MAKRGATSDLNHDNWDRDDDPEEAGSFSRASEDAIKKRIIKVAKRRNLISSTQNEGEKTTAFGGFSGFGKTAPPPTSTAFGFLSNLNNKDEVPKTNGTPATTTKKSDKNLDEYYAKLKGLNESVTEWIKKHVAANPFISLQPIFKDYDKYIADLEKMKVEKETSTTSKPIFSFGATTSSSTKFTFGTTTTTSPMFSLGTSTTITTSPSTATTLTASSTSFSSTGPFSFSTSSSSAPFSFTSKATNEETKNDDQDEEDEPPKPEFKPVVEEGHIYETRCKVFVKKDGNYADHGVGTLYLKPVPDSEKTQVFVRADTNLGNLICNFILSEGIPMQRMGKKDVMLVCLPNPETKPPPVPILLRVKSPEDADELLTTLQKHKK